MADLPLTARMSDQPPQTARADQHLTARINNPGDELPLTARISDLPTVRQDAAPDPGRSSIMTDRTVD